MHAEAVPAAASPPPGPRRRRRGLWIGVLVATIVGLALAVRLAMVFGPSLVARYVVQTYLDGLNIDTSGVETLRVRPLQGELSFGPISFRGADAERGEVGRIGVKVDLAHLLHRQALVRAILIEGVRFEVRQAEDGSFSLNGIPLGEILADRNAGAADGMPPPEDAVPPAPPARSDPRVLRQELGWGAGLDQLEVLDSRVVFIDARGGEAVMHVHRLELGGFRSWAPDKPGHYRLDAELNEIGLNASGIAKPFADKIEVEANAAVTGIEVSKIERFLGPLGFTSHAGRIDLEVGHAWFGVFTAGRIDARLGAAGTLSDVDLAHPLFGSGRLAGGTLKLDNIVGSYDATRQTTLAGDLGIDLQASTLRFGDGSEVAFARAAFGLPGTVVRTAPGLQPEVRVAPQLDVDGLRLAGGAGLRGSIGVAGVRLSGFSIEGQQPGAPFFVTGRVAAERIDLLLPAAEPVAITAGRLEVDLAETRLAFLPGQGARVEGGLALDSRQLAVSLQGQAAPGRRPPPPSRIGASRLAFRLPVLAMDGTGTGGPAVKARAPELSIDDLRLDGPALRGSVDRAALQLADAGMDSAGAPLRATGKLMVDRLDLLIPGIEPVTIATQHLRADLQEARLPLAPGEAGPGGGLAIDLHDLKVTLQEIGRNGRPPPALTTIEAARIRTTVPDASKRQDPPPGTVGVARPTVNVERLRLGGDDIRGTVGSSELRLVDVGIETASPGPPVIATGNVVARDMDLLIPGDAPIGIAARTFAADLTRTRYAFPPRRVLIEGAYALELNDLAVRLYAAAKEGRPPEPPTRIAATRVGGKLASLLVDERRRTSVRVNVAAPTLQLDGFRMEQAAGPKGVIQVGSSRLALRRADVDILHGGKLGVSVQAGVTAPDLSLALLPADGTAGPQGQLSGLDLDLRRLGYRHEGGVLGIGVRGRIGMQAMQGRLPPQAPGGPSDRLSLTGLTLDIADADLTKGGVEPEWRAHLDLAVKSAAATLHQPLAVTTSIDDVSLQGFDAASGKQYAADALTLGRLDASLTRSTPSRPQPAAAPDAKHSGGWPPEDLPPLRLGRAALLNGGRIIWRDTTVSPSVNATLALDALSIEDLNTTDAARRTRLRLAGRLDDATLSAEGWAEAFRAEPSFAVRARLDDLQLPILSPYLGPPLGLEFRRGALSLDADATATDGELDGSVNARMVGVRVADRPNAEAAEFTRSLGVPLSTLIRLLEDGEGGISVTLPVQGSVAAPEVRYSGAVWGLVPRMLRALVVSPVGFVSSARSLAAAARERRAPAPAEPAATKPDVFPVAADRSGK